MDIDQLENELIKQTRIVEKALYEQSDVIRETMTNLSSSEAWKELPEPYREVMHASSEIFANFAFNGGEQFKGIRMLIAKYRKTRGLDAVVQDLKESE